MTSNHRARRSGTTSNKARRRRTSEASPIARADLPPAKSVNVPEGERKVVTALFADLKGSTELMETLDPEAAHAIVAPLLRVMVDAVQRYGGHVARTTGDGIFALFGAPVAYEDHPQRALYAALQMQQELHAEGHRRAAKGLRSLEARVGVHTGEVVAYSVETSGRVEYRLVGHTANLAARIESIAPAGSIAVSEYTRRLCEGYFELRALGATTVKGVSEPIEVYEVLGPGALRSHFQLAARRGLTRFVGRERELEQMNRVLERAMSGHGQVVGVMAEAGTGKSRLFFEFKARIPTTCKVLEAYAVSHGKASAWLPVLELLRTYFGIQDADDGASRREKIRSALSVLDPALADTIPYLFGLLGVFESPDPIAQMDPQIKRQRTLDAIKRVVLSESLKQAVVVIFEDLHWIDEQSQALLDLITGGLARARVLLLVNYRPEYRHGWTNKSYYSQLRLDPLGSDDGATMLASMLGASVELNPLKRLITDRTGGNPFFIEEVVQALFDDGVLVRNGAVKVTRSLSQLRLPPTVQGILASRIDRQPSEQKQLLQTLAVIGRESSLGLLRQVVSRSDTQLEGMLADLQAAEFMFEQPTTRGVEYVFKHALTQEVAYNSLLIERRKQLHERAGQGIESLFADQLEDQLPQLAYHYSHSENIDKAVEYLGRAAQQAIRQSASEDAIASLSAAIDLLQKQPDSPERMRRELPLQLALGPTLIPVKGWAAPEVDSAYTRARELCRRLGDPPTQLFLALCGLWAVAFLRAQLRTAHDVGEQLMQLAQSVQNPRLSLTARNLLADALLLMGELPRARELLEEAVALYNLDDLGRQRQLAHRSALADQGVSILSYEAVVLWNLGYPDQAIKRIDEALTLARALSHPHSVTFAQTWSCNLRMRLRETRAVQEAAESMIALSTELGFTDPLPSAIGYTGWALAREGRIDEGIALMEESLAASRAQGTELFRPNTLCRLAEAFTYAGRLEDSLSALTEAEAATGREEREHEPEIHRLKGELLLKRDDSNVHEARSCFQRAIEIARKQCAKSWELRATMSLARMLREQGKNHEARAILGAIYNWFTEGFDTADLREAKTLLDELSE